MTWIQNISLFFLLSLLLCSPSRMKNKFLSFCRRIFLFTSSAAAFFTSLALNAPKSSFPFGRVQRQGQAWWSSEVEGVVRKKCKAFVSAPKSDEVRQAYFLVSRHASTVIAKAKAKTSLETCSSPSPKSDSKSVYCILRSVAGSTSSSFSNFLNCFSTTRTTLIYANY